MTDLGRTLLIVDDEPDILEILSLVFEDYEVLAALSVDAALEHLARRRCDVIITDLKLPGRSALDLVNEARACQPPIPVIVITGHGLGPPISETVFRWYRKPFRRQEIREAVEAALELN